MRNLGRFAFAASVLGIVGIASAQDVGGLVDDLIMKSQKYHQCRLAFAKSFEFTKQVIAERNDDLKYARKISSTKLFEKTKFIRNGNLNLASGVMNLTTAISQFESRADAYFDSLDRTLPDLLRLAALKRVDREDVFAPYSLQKDKEYLTKVRQNLELYIDYKGLNDQVKESMNKVEIQERTIAGRLKAVHNPHALKFAPKDVMFGSEYDKLKSNVEAAWMKAHPKDTVLDVAVIRDWQAAPYGSTKDKNWLGAYLTFAVTVKKDDLEAVVYRAYTYKSSDDVMVSTKDGTYLVDTIALQNLKR